MSINVFAGQPDLSSPNEPLAGFEDFAEWYGLGSPDAEATARIHTALEIASSVIRSGRRWFSAIDNDVVTIDGPGGPDILLPQDRLPVRDVSSITNYATGDTTFTNVVDGEYDWSESGIIYLHRDATLGRYWTARRRGIVVTYSHGYDPIPRDVAGVCLAIAKRLYDTPSGWDVRSETLGDYSVTYQGGGSGLLEHEYDLLRQYEVPA